MSERKFLIAVNCSNKMYFLLLEMLLPQEVYNCSTEAHLNCMSKIQVGPSAHERGLGWLRSWLFHCLPSVHIALFLNCLIPVWKRTSRYIYSLGPRGDGARRRRRLLFHRRRQRQQLSRRQWGQHQRPRRVRQVGGRPLRRERRRDQAHGDQGRHALNAVSWEPRT